MITAWATDTTGTAPTTGLALTTAGFLAVLATAPLACRVLYIRAHDRAYVLYHQHQAQDAALARRPRAGIY
ncbi:hypothetical protein [Streptomyces sp. LB8]|uniref:hypothetical protein n=1 Tax=Streptomyces sp. LB8 TaxID=3042509 RepID=UPI0026474D75|nr:hypothetical protein [Streptomyces sp. LB8]